jgi:hypothetical protein
MGESGRIEYNGWTIDLESYLSDCDRWRAGATVYHRVTPARRDQPIEQHRVPDPSPADYATKADADARALELAKLKIDGLAG